MKDKYDVVIIGAGIGGLVCGCYLAKTGLKVLIIEQHSKPGGYCSSFKRNGFVFDVAVHYLGACRRGGETHRIINELSIKDRLKLVRIDPTDKIITPDSVIFIRKNYRDTIESFKNNFPKEKNNIENFFNFIQRRDFLNIYAKIKNMTYAQLLEAYFNDYKLKTVFSILLGNIGLPASQASALTAVTLYREFILDPGYYPEGGMQRFADLLAERFKEFGGEIVYSQKAIKILTENKQAKGVVLENGLTVLSKDVVSNADATSTFMRLLDQQNEDVNFTIKKLIPSVSAFAVYLGISIDLKQLVKDQCSTWYFSTHNVDNCYTLLGENIYKEPLDYVVCTFPSFHYQAMAPQNKSTMGIFISAPYKSKEFWDEYKNTLAEKIIAKTEELIPSLSKYIETKVIATPHTFRRFTLNRDGAIYGWASSVGQVNRNIFPQETPIKNLYIAGHWCTSGLGQGGISVVAYAGRNAAKLILKGKNSKRRIACCNIS